MASRELTELEDLLFRAGLATHCLDSAGDDGKVTIEIVHGYDAELELYDVLQQQRSALERIFGRTVEMQFRTIVYYFAFQLFPQIAEAGPFVSTNVTNFHSPDVLEGPNGRMLRYDVMLVLVDEQADAQEMRPYLQRASALTNEFNESSRYIKVRQLEVAHTKYRAQIPGDHPLRPSRLPVSHTEWSG